MSAQVELTVIEQGGVEVTVLDAPGAQVAIGPTLSSATPQPIGTAAVGTATSVARGDHVHAHGNQTGTSLHALASTAGAGFLSAAQFDLLNGATDADTASALVKRNASGNFAANMITANLTGNVTGNLAGTASAVADNSITSDKIVDGTIVNADINATAAIAVSKLAPGAARQVPQTDAAGNVVEWTNDLALPGNLTVTGDLTVSGTTSIINTTTLEVEDKNIELGKVSSPTDTTADGGGITLKGATDKTINWVNATDAWTFSEHVDLASGKEYRIDGNKVLDAISLGPNVVSSSLTSVGTITTGTWEGAPIGTAYGGLGAGALPVDVTVASANIVNGTIVNEDINASAAIALTKLGAGALPTDITIASANLVNGTIVDADVNASAAIALSKLATGALPTDITVASANLVDGTIVDADVSGSAAIALSKLATGALPTAITVASANLVDGTIVDADVSGSAAIALSKLATGALPTAITVASANIVDGTIVNADVSASAAIAGSKVAPDFGAQNVVTTGTVTGGSLIPTGSSVPANGVYLPGANTLGLATNGVEQVRVTDAGRFCVGSIDGRAAHTFEGIDGPTSSLALARNENNTGRPVLRLFKSRGTSAGSFTIVQNGDFVGTVLFLGTDGVSGSQCAAIDGFIDGVPGVNDMPGALSFSTKASSSASTSERMRITSAGNVCIGTTTSDHRLRVNGTIQCDATLRVGTTITRNVVPTNSNTSTTATAASLLTGIRTGTPSSNNDLQMPTGTDLDAAFVSLANDQSFEWSAINLSTNHTITVTANTDHTVVGNMVVAVSTSARFTSRKTAANTFITYRIA